MSHLPSQHRSEAELLRQRVALACRILGRQGLMEGILGHVSARLDDGRMLIRCRGPRERGLLFTTARDVQTVAFDGSGSDRDPDWKPPNELAIHGEIYRARPEVGAVVHAHPRAALIAGLAGLELRCVFGAYNIAAMDLARQGVPVYPRPVLVTRPELAAELVRCMGDRAVCLMRGHGITAVGATVEEATVRAVNLEVLARVTVELAMLGARPEPVSEADLAELPDLGPGFQAGMVWRQLAASVDGEDA